MELSFLLMRSIISMALMCMMGYAAARLGALQPEDSHAIAVLALYVVCPCAIISSFQIEFSKDKLFGLGVAFVAAVVIHGVLVALARLSRRAFGLDEVEEASLVYSNCGNLILPLVYSMLGPEYVLYASPYLAVQVLILWTHGVRLLNPKEPIRVKKVLLNPGVIAIAVGMFLFFANLRLPQPVREAASSVGACMGPLGMFSIGLLLSQADWKQAFGSARSWLVAVGRLIVLPGLLVLLAAASRVTVLMPGAKQVLVVSFLAAAAPVAVTVSQFASLFGSNDRKAGAINVLTVILSVGTLPLMTAFYLTIC